MLLQLSSALLGSRLVLDGCILLGLQLRHLAFQHLHPGGLLIAGLLSLLQRFSLISQLLLEGGSTLLCVDFLLLPGFEAPLANLPQLAITFFKYREAALEG